MKISVLINNFWKHPRMPAIVIALLCVLGYFLSLNHQFLLDDYFILFNESGVANKSFIDLFTSQQHIFYRPIGHVLFWGVYKIFGTAAFWYRALGLVQFYAICFLIYKILDKITSNRRLALLTASLFALHPVNNMLINNIAAYVLLMYTLLLFTAFYCVVEYLETRQNHFYVFGILSFVLSLFCHEMSMAFPAYVFCFVYFLKDSGFKKTIIFTLPFIGVAVLYFWFRMTFFSLKEQSAAVTVALNAFPAYLSSVMSLMYWYLGKMIFPQDVLFLWSTVIEDSFNPYEIYRVILIVVLVIYLIFARWKKGLKPFALSVFVIGLLPAFSASYAHFPFAEPMIEPHWFYFASLGFFILAAEGILFLKAKLPEQRSWILPASVLFSLFLLLQISNRNWKDQETYCRFWISKNVSNATPFYGMGQFYLSRGEHDQAIEYLGKAFNLSHRYQSAFLTADLGYAYLLKGDYDSARKNFAAAIKNEPAYSVTYYYLGLLAWRQGDKNSAEQFLSKAVNLYPRRKLYREELALVQAGHAPVGMYPLFILE